MILAERRKFWRQASNKTFIFLKKRLSSQIWDRRRLLRRYRKFLRFQLPWILHIQNKKWKIIRISWPNLINFGLEPQLIILVAIISRTASNISNTKSTLIIWRWLRTFQKRRMKMLFYSHKLIHINLCRASSLKKLQHNNILIMYLITKKTISLINILQKIRLNKLLRDSKMKT